MIYQRASDKHAEHAIAAVVAARWRVEAVEFPYLSPIDWYLKRGPRLVAFMEIKDRHRASDAFGTVLLDVMKLQALIFAALAFSAKAFFVVRFTDGVFYAEASTLVGLPVRVCGRTDRQDVNDTAPCVDIPIGRLTRLGESAEDVKRQPEVAEAQRDLEHDQRPDHPCEHG